MDVPETRYARSGDVRIAYQVFGSGPVDIVYGRTSISQLELVWEEPEVARYFHELGTFSRVVLWDKRGVGLSDRAVGAPTLEDRMDDVRAVMDAVGSRQAVVFGATDTAAMALLFAATYPERTLGLVLIAPLVRGLRAPDYPWRKTREEYELELRRSEADWGSPAHIDRVVARLAPSRIGDAAFTRWLGRVVRFGSSPSADLSLARMNMEIDVREALSAVHVPTIVLHAPDDTFVEAGNAQYVVDHVAGARFEPMPGGDHLMWANPAAFRASLDAQRRFLAGLPARPTDEDRVLLTVLFVDIDASTRRATELGDAAWTALLGRFLAAAAAEAPRFRGTFVKSTGDGFLATFDGPTRAVRCAQRLRDLARDLGLSVRAGVHTGECLPSGNDVSGIAVHIAARVCDAAASGEILASATVHDLSAGSSVGFAPRPSRALKGLDGTWSLFAVGPS